MRGKQATRRVILPDDRFQDVLVARFINQVMERGKRSTAEKIVYEALEIASKKSNAEPLNVFREAMKNIEPTVEVRSRRIGGANYQIPIEVRGGRREALAMRWLIGAARGKKGKRMAEKLAMEFQDALNKQGDAYKKKEDVRRMAEANRAFAHFA